ncbi:MAG TPA: hypothetical protein VIL74_25845 [Pyrinomonadaceae bacterium]|jgi:outer membrane lipoprotein-sorting protein
MKTFKFAACCLLIAAFSVSALAQKMRAEDVIARHLESIGTAETRGAVKSRIAVGEATVTFVSQKNQSAQGRIVMASENAKNFLGMNLNAVDYPFEKFSFDGSKSKVAAFQNNVRTDLGSFILSNDLLLEESLLGGTLATSWALANIAASKAKVSFDGTKKIDGKEVYVLGYSPKGGSDLDIKLFFDKETFRHVRTEYKRISSAGIGRTPDQSSGYSETRLKVTENFGDYKPVKGMTLPHSYVINYSVSGQRGTSEIEWKFALTEFAFNPQLDDKTFDADAR